MKNKTASPKQQEDFKNCQRILLRSQNLNQNSQNDNEIFKKTYQTKSEYKNLRGKIDLIFLKKRYHNENIHQYYSPNSLEAKNLFDSLENLRLEAIGMRSFPGIAKNIKSLILNNWKFKKNLQPQELTIEDALSLVIRKILNPKFSIKNSEKYFAYWYQIFFSPIKDTFQHIEKNLRSNLYSQRAFAATIADLLDFLNIDSSMKNLFQKEKNTCENAEEFSFPLEQESIKNKNSSKNISKNQGKHQKNMQNSSLSKTQSMDTKFFSIDSDEIGKSEKKFTKQVEAPSCFSNKLKELSLKHEESYKIFTKNFDITEKAQNLASKAQLIKLEETLKKELEKYKNISSHLARRLQKILVAKEQKTWNFNTETGILDTTKLSSIIIDPSQNLSFKSEAEGMFRNIAITLLLDNSGSMRGKSILLTTICAVILMETLQRCKVTLEILGFTTKEWRGGKSRKQWIQEGSPFKPGRLNDLLHIIYKDAEQNPKKAKRSLALMLQEGLLKENIDGEALLWAAKRLEKRNEKRKILIIISDGAPIDDSTLSANSIHYLDQHLKTIIQKIEKKGNIELLAIGIAHDVSRYYKKAVTIKDSQTLSQTLFQELLKLFTKQDKF